MHVQVFSLKYGLIKTCPQFDDARIAQRLENCVHFKAEIPIRTSRKQDSALDSLIHHKKAVTTNCVSAGLQLSLNDRGKNQRGPASGGCIFSLRQVVFSKMVTAVNF